MCMRLKTLYMKRYNNTQSNYIFHSPPHTYVCLEATVRSASKCQTAQSGLMAHVINVFGQRFFQTSRLLQVPDVFVGK